MNATEALKRCADRAHHRLSDAATWPVGSVLGRIAGSFDASLVHIVLDSDEA